MRPISLARDAPFFFFFFFFFFRLLAPFLDLETACFSLVNDLECDP